MLSLFFTKPGDTMEFIYSDPVTDFSNGLVVLKTYHEDFLDRGVKLLELVAEIKQQGVNESLANQCAAMLCHFGHANNLHHQDEEQGLFPLLVGQSQLIDGMIERLMMDHEEIEKSWALLAEKLSSPEQIKDYDQLMHLAGDFEKIHREHLTREDEDFSPKVKAILDTEQIQQAGKKMAELRHLKT
jgi:hemerythrin-like domain-containing protein